jgi:hypothetical protein
MQHEPREAARRATIMAYANRVCEGVRLADGSSLWSGLKVMYPGNFPYRDVALAAPMPIDPKDHKRCWGELFRIFDEEWRVR